MSRCGGIVLAFTLHLIYSDTVPKSSQIRRSSLIIGGIFFILLTLFALVGVTQLQVVREFFSQADGEPANILVDTQGIVGTMPRPWRHLAQGGESHDWRMGSITGQVKALNPKFIRLDHIYSFYDVVGGSPGNVTFDFTKLDPVLDDIKATGATPYIALSYMPQAISSGDILSKPVNWADWQLVVQRTIQHISGTRGFDNVYYEVWNEPDLFGDWKYYGDKSYIELYNTAARGADAAARTAKVKPFKFGGPGITALYKNWFDALAKNAIANNVRFDFFSWHRYTTDINKFREDMSDARTWLSAYPQLQPTTELHITEWGHDSKNHPGYDTAYAAAHTVAGAIEMVGYVEKAFVFEIQDGKDPAGAAKWGRWGMFTHQDFGSQAKPRYYGLRLLERLGPQRLQLLGKGTFVKALAAQTTDGVTQVLLANYDPKGRNQEAVPVTFQNITPGSYTITKETLAGQKTTEKVATTAATLRTTIQMPASSVALVELRAD